jgi:hypothetical protein
MTYRLAKSDAEEAIHFTADLAPMDDDEKRDIIVQQGGAKRMVVIQFDDSEPDGEGDRDLKGIHIDSTGFPTSQLAFVLHEVSHMLHESEDYEQPGGLDG